MLINKAQYVKANYIMGFNIILLNEITYLNKRKKTRLGAVLSNSSFIAQ